MDKIERFTDRANKVMELALREALSLGHSYVGTEHVLLGLVREGEGVAAQVLVMDLGLDLGSVRKAVIERLSGYHSEETKIRNHLRLRGVDPGHNITGQELRAIAEALGWEADDAG